MRRIPFLSVFVLVITLSCFSDDAARVQKAIQHSTLDQPGTKPFHLEAWIGASRQPEQHPEFEGQVEIWWESPARYRREVRGPEFHQVEIVDGEHRWQKNEGDYFPEWLRRTAVELVRPVPNVDEALAGVREADVKSIFGSTYFQWQIPSSNGQVESRIGATVALTNSTGLLFYCGGFGWGGLFHDYRNFHGRMVAMKVQVGSPEVTATVQTLEDLKPTPGDWFNAQTPGGDPHLLDTIVIDEASERKHLLNSEHINWPPVKDGPLQGVSTAEIVIDRRGTVREIGPVVTTNNALASAVRSALFLLKFSPYEVNSVPVQVITRIMLPFQTVRAAQTGPTSSAAVTDTPPGTRYARMILCSPSGSLVTPDPFSDKQDRSGFRSSWALSR